MPAPPTITNRANSVGGSTQFSPADPVWPEVELERGHFDLAWNPKDDRAEDSMQIVEHAIQEDAFGIRGDRLAGVIRIDGSEIAIQPFFAELSGKPVGAAPDYNLESGEGEATLRGVGSNQRRPRSY